MKRILVISDSHGNVKALDKLKCEMQKADYIFHLGDHWYDMKPYLSEFDKKIYTVFGNCDGGGEDYEIVIEGVKILLTHGDRYHVKSSLFRLYLKALEIGAKLVFFGHTHTAVNTMENGVYLVNPGALSNALKLTYCIAELDDGRIDINHYELE